MKDDTQEVVNYLSHFVNNFNCPVEEVTNLIMMEHRTLQQNLMRLIMKLIEKWSQQEYYDLRNEGTIKLCKRIMEAVKDDIYLPYRCGMTIYKCNHCGSVGCTRSECKNSNFLNGVCRKCRKMGKKPV